MDHSAFFGVISEKDLWSDLNKMCGKILRPFEPTLASVKRFSKAYHVIQKEHLQLRAERRRNHYVLQGGDLEIHK
jgi:hypothetical protein